jgi:hypothetical protein
MKFMAVLILTSALFTIPAFGKRKGNEGGHGGDSYAAEFVWVGFEIAAHLDRPEYAKLRTAVDLEPGALKQVISQTLVYSAEPNNVKIGEEIVEAINFPNGPIRMNRVSWREASLIHKLKVVLHEYFAYLKIELDTYEVSSRFDSALQTLAARKLIEKSEFIRYYGTAVGSPPLNAGGSMCSAGQPWVREARQLASSIAEERCKLERATSCTAIAFIPREVQSTVMPGFQYCEITAITR